MNDLLRPALYGANHAIVPVVEPAAGVELAEKDVVGPICETGDTFATRRPLPPVAAGELLVLRTAGAYGAVMASTYNGRPLVPEVLVNGDVFAVVSERPSEDDLLARQRMPDWLEPKKHDDSRSAAGGRS
jgi:diaminopimelate decarboxylase